MFTAMALTLIVEAAAIVLLSMRSAAWRRALIVVCRAVEALDTDENVRLKVVRENREGLEVVHSGHMRASARYVKRHTCQALTGMVARMVDDLVKSEIEKKGGGE